MLRALSYLQAHLIEDNLGGLLSHVDVLEEGAVGVVGLLLDGGAELEELVGHGLVGALEDVDQSEGSVSFCLGNYRLRMHIRSGVSLILLGEEGDGLAGLAGTTCSANAVDVVLDREGELEGDQQRLQKSQGRWCGLPSR